MLAENSLSPVTITSSFFKATPISLFHNFDVVHISIKSNDALVRESIENTSIDMLDIVPIRSSVVFLAFK